MLPADAPPLAGPRGQFNATTLDELGLLLLSGNAQDVAEILKIIEELEEVLHQEAAAVAVELER